MTGSVEERAGLRGLSGRGGVGLGSQALDFDGFVRGGVIIPEVVGEIGIVAERIGSGTSGLGG